MKKTIRLALVCTLVLSLITGFFPAGAQDAPPESVAPNSSALEETQSASPEGEAAENDRYFDSPDIGLRFLLPDVWYATLYESPHMTLNSYQYGFSFDFLSGASLEALTQLMSDQGLPVNEADFTPEQKTLMETFQKGAVPLCAITYEKEGERDADLRSMYPEETVLGEKDGTTYTLRTNPDADLSALSEEEQARYRALRAATADFEKDMTLSGVPEMNFEGAVSFSSQTIDGKAIDSSVFQQNKLTMVNIWATWCGPCVSELPELQKLSGNLPEGVDMLGICTDGAEEPDTAKMILEKSGVTYDNVVANEEMATGFLANIQAFPTTLFVDSEGNLVGEPFAGAPSSDVEAVYQEEIQKRLDMLDQ